MKYRRWVLEGNKGRFEFLEKNLNLSCNAYNPPNLPNETPLEESWEQFSGVLDKNGKEVFQGDIAVSVGRVGQVLKTENGFEFETNEHKEALWEVTVGSNGRTFEVIGNIHENPDLIL